MAVTNLTIVYNVLGAFETIKNYFSTPYPRQEKTLTLLQITQF